MENTAAYPATMPAGISPGFGDVNSHYLEHVVDLSETHQIIASDDIHDSNGIKLWAKGAPISRSLHEKLLRRRLARPLESSLSIEAGITMEIIVADAFALIEENATFSALAGSSDARGLMRDAQKSSLPGPVKLLLTSAREGKKSNYLHTLATMLVCAGIASRLQFTAHDGDMLLVAALVHDIGEMYVNPEYLNSTKPLSPAEWKHVASHPCVGHQFLREFTNFPAGLADCVLHHHERLDGSGYPFQLGGSSIGRLGAILGIADSVAAIVLRGGNGIRTRLEVALRIVPEEFDRKVASTIDGALRGLPEETSCSESPESCLDRLGRVLQQLASSRTAAEALVGAVQAAAVAAVARYVLSVLGTIEKNLRATGVFEADQLAKIENDPQIIGEACLVFGEVSWRLRSLARNVHLRIEKSGNPAELASVSSLIATLDPLTQGNA